MKEKEKEKVLKVLTKEVIFSNPIGSGPEKKLQQMSNWRAFARSVIDVGIVPKNLLTNRYINCRL